jgi:hypothetical protein
VELFLKNLCGGKALSTSGDLLFVNAKYGSGMTGKAGPVMFRRQVQYSNTGNPAMLAAPTGFQS